MFSSNGARLRQYTPQTGRQRKRTKKGSAKRQQSCKRSAMVTFIFPLGEKKKSTKRRDLRTLVGLLVSILCLRYSIRFHRTRINAELPNRRMCGSNSSFRPGQSWSQFFGSFSIHTLCGMWGLYSVGGFRVWSRRIIRLLLFGWGCIGVCHMSSKLLPRSRSSSGKQSIVGRGTISPRKLLYAKCDSTAGNRAAARPLIIWDSRTRVHCMSYVSQRMIHLGCPPFPQSCRSISTTSSALCDRRGPHRVRLSNL